MDSGLPPNLVQPVDLVVPPALLAHFVQAKRLADRGSPAIEQRALAGLISGGRFERLPLAAAKRLDLRPTALIHAIDECFRDDALISGGTAGVHLCLQLHQLPACSEGALVAAAARADVLVEGIGRYCVRAAAAGIEAAAELRTVVAGGSA